MICRMIEEHLVPTLRGNALPGRSASARRKLLQHNMFWRCRTQSVQSVRDDAKRRHEVRGC